jgi:2Fe-2S ferredoxin
MPQITFITADGAHRTVDARNGDSVMQTAIKNGIPGIDADCGGACACATCHVYVDESWKDRVSKVGDMESSMLDFAQVVLPNSRLSCQLQVVEALDGLVVAIPESQH